MNKQLGERIRKLRIRENIHVKDMADAIGILDTSYSKIEREGTNNLKTLIKISELLHTGICSLIPESSTQSVAENEVRYGLATREDINKLTHMLQGVISDMQLLKTKSFRKKRTLTASKYKTKYPLG